MWIKFKGLDIKITETPHINFKEVEAYVPEDQLTEFLQSLDRKKVCELLELMDPEIIGDREELQSRWDLYSESEVNPETVCEIHTASKVLDYIYSSYGADELICKVGIDEVITHFGTETLKLRLESRRDDNE